MKEDHAKVLNKPSLRLAVLTILMAVGLVASGSGENPEPDTVVLSVPDTCAAPGDTLGLTVLISDVTDSAVLGSQLKVVYDSAFVKVLNVDTKGTIAEAWQLCAWNVLEGQDTLRVATAGITPLKGRGKFLNITLLVLEESPTDSTAPVNIRDPLLNEGSPAVTSLSGLIRVPCPGKQSSSGREHDAADY